MPAFDVRERKGGVFIPWYAAKPSWPWAVSAGLLDWHAAFTGGPVPGTWSSELAYRASTVSAMRSILEAVTTNGWVGTDLHRHIELSEKVLLSYRLGTVMAGVAADVCLGILGLTHRETLMGKLSGPRGDLLGFDIRTFRRHGVEAKGHAPDATTGNRAYVAPGTYDGARGQAKRLGSDLLAFGVPRAWVGDEHWAITTRSATSERIEVVLEDPLAEEPPGPPPELEPDADLSFPDPEERLLQGFYRVAGQIEAAAAAGSRPPAALARQLSERADGDYVWAPLPASDRWIGARRDLLEARREARLRDFVRVFGDRTAFADDDFGARRIGLAVRFVPGSQGA